MRQLKQYFRTVGNVGRYQDDPFSKDPSLDLDTIEDLDTQDREIFTEYCAILTESMSKVRNPT